MLARRATLDLFWKKLNKYFSTGGMDSNDSFSSSLNMVIEPGQVILNLQTKNCKRLVK